MSRRKKTMTISNMCTKTTSKQGHLRKHTTACDSHPIESITRECELNSLVAESASAVNNSTRASVRLHFVTVGRTEGSEKPSFCQGKANVEEGYFPAVDSFFVSDHFPYDFCADWLVPFSVENVLIHSASLNLVKRVETDVPHCVPTYFFQVILLKSI